MMQSCRVSTGGSAELQCSVGRSAQRLRLLEAPLLCDWLELLRLTALLLVQLHLSTGASHRRAAAKMWPHLRDANIMNTPPATPTCMAQDQTLSVF